MGGRCRLWAEIAIRGVTGLFHVDCVEEPPWLTRVDSGCDGNRAEGFEPSALCGEDWRRERDKLGQFLRFWAVGRPTGTRPWLRLGRGGAIDRA
jgi:hypothetical protein